MRFKKCSRTEEELLSSSSLNSRDSNEIFWSPGSALSDCECCDRRQRYYNKYYSTPFSSPPSSPPSQCYHSAMSGLETSPLLGTTSPLYKTLEYESDSLGPADLSSAEILKSPKRFDEKPEVKKQSSLVTIFSVWNTIMGSSLLTMAWGVERAGLSMALLLMVTMAALCLYTAYLLLEVNRYHGSSTCEVPALCRRLLGRGAEAVAHVFSLVVLVGATVVYWILITNFLYYTVNYFVDLSSSNSTYTSSPVCPHGVNITAPPPEHNAPWYWAPRSTVPLYVAAIVFPLLNFRSVTFFTKFNSLGTLAVLYLMIFVIIKGYVWGVHLPALPSFAGRDAAVLSGMLALSFYIHNIIVTVMNSNRDQHHNGRDLTIAFALVTVTYALVGAVFYICFPLDKACIEDNILNNFDMHDIMTAVARILLLFQVVTVYPLVAFMLRTEAALLLPVKDSTCLMVTINTAIVTVCILVACFCPSIGTIIRYTGAVSGLVHIFALPSLLYMRSLKLRGELSWTKAVFFGSIMVFGAVNLIMQFFINE